MTFRKHQVDCLRPWRLPSPWILKRILLAIFNIRTGAKGAGACRGALLRRGFARKRGAGMAGGLRAGVFCQVELSKRGPLLSEHQHAGMPAERGTGAPRASRQCKAICQAHPHSSESQNEAPTQSTHKKGWTQSVRSRRREASACGKTIATVPFRHLEPRDQSGAGMRTHNTRATGREIQRFFADSAVKPLDNSTCRSRDGSGCVLRAATRPALRIPRIRGGAASGRCRGRSR